MRVLSFPVRLDGSGSLQTIAQGSGRDAQQLAQCIYSTIIGERELAPDFGIFDPIGVGLASAEVVAAVALCEPDVVVSGVSITGPKDSRQSVAVSVRWADEES